MKLITFTLLLFLLSSCNQNGSNEQDSPVDSTATIDEIPSGPTEEELKLIALKEERKRLKMNQINDALNKYVVDYMKYNSPNTGERPSYSILSENYNELTESIEVDFEATWYACVIGMFCDKKELHQVNGKITWLGTSEKIVWSNLVGNKTLIESDNYTEEYNKAIEEGRKSN